MSSILKLNTINIRCQLDHEKILQSYTSLAFILSGQILTALQWQEFFLHAICYLQSSILTLHVRKILMQLQFPEIIGEKVWTERVDIRDVDVEDLKIIEQAGKKEGKKKSGKKSTAEKGKSEENNAEKRKEEEEKRQREWEEAWNKKLEAQEALEDEAFCAAHGFYPKPKTQTNLWFQVSHGKAMQDVQFCFKNVPISKPKPPPLLPLKIEEAVKQPASDEKKGGKKKGKKK